MGQNPSSNHFRKYRLGDAAKDGRVLMCKCTGCRRNVYYLAEDLVELLGGDWDPALAPFECSRCGTDRYIFVAMRLPAGRLRTPNSPPPWTDTKNPNLAQREAGRLKRLARTSQRA